MDSHWLQEITIKIYTGNISLAGNFRPTSNLTLWCIPIAIGGLIIFLVQRYFWTVWWIGWTSSNLWTASYSINMLCSIQQAFMNVYLSEWSCFCPWCFHKLSTILTEGILFTTATFKTLYLQLQSSSFISVIPTPYVYPSRETTSIYSSKNNKFKPTIQ